MTQASRFLTAKWLDLAMLNYEIDPALLLKRAPLGTELDSWNGKVFISIVGFRFLDARLLGVPIPWHRNFEEVNLRFYVRRNTPAGVRRGVVFVKEIVPRTAIAWLARKVYNENYVALPMRNAISLNHERLSTPAQVSYEWRYDHRWHRLRVEVDSAPYLPEDDAEETFITEHYWGYVTQRDGSTVEYQVEHPRWRVWRASGAELDCDVSALYGAEFANFLRGAPSSAFVADGSAVTVHRGVRLD